MTPARLILLAPCSLLIGALLQLLVARFFSARAKGILAALSCLPALVAVGLTLPLIQAGRSLDLHLFAWDGPLAIVLHVDALSLLFAFMGACLGGIVLLYSIGYMARDRAATRFYATMLVFICGFITLVYSANLLFFYVCWEVVGLCSFSLVGFWYSNEEAVRGARKVLLMTHLAGYGLLAAILILFHRTGSVLWTDPAVAHAFSGGIFLLMLVALIAKSVQVPLHTWIPEAMAAPTPVSALLHAACYVKAGVYLAARMYSFGAHAPSWNAVVVWIGTITMLVGVMYAMVQTDLKRMLAFHTVSQIGYMITGLGIGTPLGITAGLLHCLNHGFFKGGLFLSAGAVQHAAGTRDMNELGGLAQRMPRTTLVWLISVGSMMGIPLMSGFTSKWMLYTAALQSGWTVPALVAWVVSLGTVFSCVKATNSVFLGSATQRTENAHEASLSMQMGLGLIATGSLVLGVAPQLAMRFFLNPVLAVLGMGEGIQVTWFGLVSPAGSFSTAGGLMLAVVSIVFGGLIYLMARPARATSGAILVGAGGGGVFTGGEPLSSDGRLPAHDFSAILDENWHTFFRWTNVDRAYLRIGITLTTISEDLGKIVAWAERNSASSLIGIGLAFLAGMRWFAGPVSAIESPGATRGPLLLLVGCTVAWIALLIAALANQVGRRHVLLMALSGLLAVAGLYVSKPSLRLALLELASAVTVLLVWRSTTTLGTKLAYLTMFAVSAMGLVLSDLFAMHGQTEWARALFVTGILVKLAAVPLLFWLLRLADEVPALVLGLIIAVIDIAAFGELFILAQSSPWLITPHGLWLAVAGASAMGGSLLMLSQRSLKRLLVLSTIEDIGFLLLGIISATTLSLSGAVTGAVTHALAKALLFTSLSTPEAAGALSQGRGLASRFPVSGAGFLFGMLAMLGVPPTLGYPGRWRLYETALQNGPLVLLVFVLSSAFSLIAYVLALTRFWWGPPDDSPSTTAEPWLLRGTILVLIFALLAAGLWPNAIASLHWRLP